MHHLVTLSALLLSPLGVARAQVVPPLRLAPAPDELRFELHLPEGKTQFQIGETIPVRLLFSNAGTRKLALNTFRFSEMTRFASFPATQQGVVNPLGDLPTPTGFAYEGPGPERPTLLTSVPTEKTLTLNEYLRFDKPGSHTVRATTSEVIPVPEAGTRPLQGSFLGGNTVATSTPLSIVIMPADPKWQHEQVQAWRAYWAKQKPEQFGYGWASPSGVSPPANDLRFLNTREAAQAMIDRLGQDIAPRSSGSEAYFWRLGFIGFSDRAWLIEAMQSALKRPDYPVTEGFLDILGALQTLQDHLPTKPNPFGFSPAKATEATNWNQAFTALDSKKGYARSMTAFSLLDADFTSLEGAALSHTKPAPYSPELLPCLVAMVPDIFLDLPRLPQEYLLDVYGHSETWERIKSPRLAAPLVRLWNTRTPDSPYAYNRDIPDAILTRLNEVAPQEARPLILKEMARPWPRASFKALSLLPAQCLPASQEIWLKALDGNGGDTDTAALLIGRYANEAIKTQVQRKYAQLKRERLLSTPMNKGLSRFLARVK